MSSEKEQNHRIIGENEPFFFLSLFPVRKKNPCGKFPQGTCVVLLALKNSYEVEAIYLFILCFKPCLLWGNMLVP